LAGQPETGETDDALKVLLRTASTSEPAAARLHAIFTTQLTRVVASGPADPEEAPLRAGLIATQVMGMAFRRYVQQLAPVTETTRDEVVAWFTAHLAALCGRRALTGLASFGLEVG
jgi:hypothetical protein